MRYEDIKTVLSIAGSDSSGGAGIQADIKTILANGCYAMTAITALTAQNTQGVFGIEETRPEFLELQMKAVFEDIVPDAVKIGMVSSPELIRVIAKQLKKYQAKNIVLDPVMVSTSGSRLLSEDALSVLTDELFPIASLITPNIPEAELLCGCKIINAADMERACRLLADRYKAAVLLKGGHSIHDANDFLICETEECWLNSERIDNPNTHGTGCTLSSAIASNLAKGYSIPDSVRNAKEYLVGALSHGINLGKKRGPLNHGWK